MAAVAPIVTFDNNTNEYSFPFRAIVYADPLEIGALPNPCGLEILGEVYVRPLPPYSSLAWDVAGRDIRFMSAGTGGFRSTTSYIEVNDPPAKRFFAVPCSMAHLVVEPATMCVDDLGSDAYEADGVTFTPPRLPTVTLALQERVSCP